jgi:aminoglycoside phosphotransferase (APT) family kinase protein
MSDPVLDRWLAAFDAQQPARQPLHGDFYAGNTLVRDGRIVALLDWDDAFCGPPEQELAQAAWEWGDGLSSFDLSAAERFTRRYAAAGGPAEPLTGGELAQLIRERLRIDVAWRRAAWRHGTPCDAADVEHEARQPEAFDALRP